MRRALASVERQTLQPYEVIVVDDGSCDDTAQMVAREYPKVRYLYQRQAGVSAARNLGIRQARGAWLCFLDSDDEWLPQKLERQTTQLAAQPGYALVHNDEIWIRDGKRVNPMRKHQKTGGWIFQRCLPLCVISPSAAMIQRRVFDEVGLFDTSLPACEDYDMWLRICARYPVLYLDQALIIKYGGHDDQLSRRYWGMDRFRIQALHKILEADILGPEDRAATITVLSRKLCILISGAKKRGHEDNVRYYRTLQQHYLGDTSEMTL